MSELQKRLETRHLNMIALGGSIGTGTFLASGYSIYVGGPGAALLAYGVMALVVYVLMTSLAEMSIYQPSSGSFCEYSSEYVGKSFGFAMGYNYWFNWAITVAVELVAASVIMNYWFPQVNDTIFLVMFFIIIVLFNLFSVKIYGEVEYWLSFIKVSIIIIFIILGTLAIFYQPHFGVSHWTKGDAPFHNGWLGFITVFLFVGFSFQGTELIGVASGEAKNPEVSVPKSIKLVFWRLSLFYIATIAIVSLLISYDDPMLASQDNVNMSPYTLIFSRYISHHAADFINFVILVALLSAANASMYSASRILWYMGKKGQASPSFSKITRHGVPMMALIATALVASVVFISSKIGDGILFSYLVQVSSLSGFIAWFGISLCHLSFRKKHVAAGTEKAFKYKARFYPYAQIFSLFLLGFVVIAQVFPLMQKANYHISDVIIVYSSLILFAVLYVGHKIYSVKYKS